MNRARAGATSSRRQVPVAAERAQVGVAAPLDPREQGGVERIALRAVAALARAGALSFLGGRFLAHRAEKVAGADARCNRVRPGAPEGSPCIGAPPARSQPARLRLLRRGRFS